MMYVERYLTPAEFETGIEKQRLLGRVLHSWKMLPRWSNDVIIVAVFRGRP